MNKKNNFNEYFYYKLAENIVYGDENKKLKEYILTNENINVDILARTILNILKEKSELKQLTSSGKNNIYFFFYFLKDNIERFSPEFVADYHNIIEILNDHKNTENSKEYFMSQALIRRLEFGSLENLKERVKRSLEMDLSILMTHTDFENSIIKDDIITKEEFNSLINYYSYNEIYLGSLNTIEYEYPKLFNNNTFKNRSVKVLKNNKSILKQLFVNKYFIDDNKMLMETIYGSRNR